MVMQVNLHYVKCMSALLGYKLIPNNKNNINNDKTKFTDDDESKMSEWMNIT